MSKIIKDIPIIQVKTGIWVNSRKLRKTLTIICIIYTLLLLITGIKFIAIDFEFIGIMFIFSSSPMILILYSRYKYHKLNGVIDIK